MKQLYFTADEHYSHSNIIKYCNRPFETVEEMDSVIISNFNSKVDNNDITFHLGDFTFKDPKPYLQRLNGQHYLITGNHDRISNGLFGWVKDSYLLQVSNIQIFLSHYAHRVFPHAHHGAIHLYGHSHGTLPPYGRSFDVGVDTNNFMPYSLDDIIKKAKTLKPIHLVCNDPLEEDE